MLEELFCAHRAELTAIGVTFPVKAPFFFVEREKRYGMGYVDRQHKNGLLRSKILACIVAHGKKRNKRKAGKNGRQTPRCRPETVKTVESGKKRFALSLHLCKVRVFTVTRYCVIVLPH